jgi:hypothetical protein
MPTTKGFYSGSPPSVGSSKGLESGIRPEFVVVLVIGFAHKPFGVQNVGVCFAKRG